MDADERAAAIVRGCPAIVDRAPLDCPACRHRFAAEWMREPGEDWRAQQDQACSSCGHTWAALWPGFEFQPRVRVLDGADAT